MLARLSRVFRAHGIALAVGLIGTFAAACAVATRPAAAVTSITAVRAAREDWNSALARRDSVSLARLVEDSAVHMAPRFVHVGREAFLDVFLRNMSLRAEFRLTYEPEQVIPCDRAACDVATEYGRWRETWLELGEATEVSGTYYALWRRHGSAWQIRGESFATLECRGRRYCGP